MVQPELFQIFISGEKLSPKDLLNLRDKINSVIDYLGYSLYQIVYFDIPLNDEESKFHINNPTYNDDKDMANYQISGDFSFLFPDAVMQNGLMVDNHIVAKRLESEFKKIEPDNIINFDSECSCCYIESEIGDDIFKFRDCFYETYIISYINNLKDELKIKGFYNKEDNKIEFEPKNK